MRAAVNRAIAKPPGRIPATTLNSFPKRRRAAGGFGKTSGNGKTLARRPLSPDLLYDRAWAVTLLERVVARLREEHLAEEKAAQFDHLKPFLTMGKGAIPYADVSAELDMTEGAARVAVHRLRQRYRELLREEVAHTVARHEEIDEELRYLIAVIRG